MKSTVVSLRLKPEELAKALEGLATSNIEDTNLTLSNIVRTTFYYGIIHLCENPNQPASTKFIEQINEILNKKKKPKTVGIKDLLGED
jgi:hypothetical protein